MALMTYKDFADNDYDYFLNSYQAGFVANQMGAIAQGICEKYMKHLISEYDDAENDAELLAQERVLKTHSLNRLAKYLEEKLDIAFSENTLNKMRIIDGYYFSTRYPGDESMELDSNDIYLCVQAVVNCKKEIEQIIAQMDIILSEESVRDNINYTYDDEMEL